MLSHRLRRGPLPISETIDLGISLSQVLGQLHASGIVHCDIKPSNIGFAANGLVKLVDFGLAYLLRDSGPALATTLTRSSDSPDLSVILTARGVMGTPAYMSPEATVAATPAPGFDLWGLAVVLFEAISGKRPFSGQNADEMFHSVNTAARPDARASRPECPDDIAAFLADAIAIDPMRRPKTAHEFSSRLSVLRSTVA
jgi:serine/threonine-protein kinase